MNIGILIGLIVNIMLVLRGQALRSLARFPKCAHLNSFTTTFSRQRGNGRTIWHLNSVATDQKSLLHTSRIILEADKSGKNVLRGLKGATLNIKEIARANYGCCMELYDDIVAEGSGLTIMELSAMLNVCTKAEHLKGALRLVQHMHSSGDLPSSGYLTMIRCYADGQHLEEARKWLRMAVDAKVDIKARLFQPIIEVLVDRDDLQGVVDLIFHMLELNVMIKEEQFAPLLSVLGKPKVRKELQTNASLREALHKLIEKIGEDLFGLSISTVVKIVGNNTHMDSAAVEAQGVLVGTLDDITGQVVDDTQLTIYGSVIAENTSFDKNLLEIPPAAVSTKNSEPAQPSITFVQEKYVVLSELEKLKKNASSPETVSGSRSSEAALPFMDIIKQPFTHSAARLVDISRSTSRCPNCDGLVMSIGLTEEERRGAAQEVEKFAQQKHLHKFASMLRKGQYEYIVDAANVAYCRQNFVGGRFSFAQIELVVETLKQRSDRILVILPQCYAQKGKIPNSIRANGSGSRGKKGAGSPQQQQEVTEDDQRILDKLRDENMLFVTPLSTDDDWFWIYSTLFEGQKGPVYVVSNDHMRDHKVMFADKKTFLRWRSAHIAYFDLIHPVLDEKAKVDAVDALTDINANTEPGPVSAPEVVIHTPSKITRELQRSTVGDFWHIPALDRNVWLCLNAAAPASQNDTTSHQ